MYKLTEKFLMLFPFYRERVRVMDDYAIRLSEAVDALADCRDDLDDALEQARSSAQLVRKRDKTIAALMKIDVPAVIEAGKEHGAAHMESLHGIPRPDAVAKSLYPDAPGIHSHFIGAFNRNLKPRW